LCGYQPHAAGGERLKPAETCGRGREK